MKTNWLETPRGDIRARDAVLYATLSPKGYFSINRMTFQRLGEPQAVHLLYDDINNRIGLKPCASVSRNAYPLVRRSSAGRRTISGYRVLVEHGIRLPATVRFYDAEIDQDGILILDLRTARVPPNVLRHQTTKEKVKFVGKGGE